MSDAAMPPPPQEQQDEMFRPVGNVSNEDEDRYLPTVVESMCMNCHDSGETRLLLTKIPFFREVVIMSFECPHCGFRNNEVQPAGQIQERGCTHRLAVTTKEDLNRHLIIADSASLTLEELQFERPVGKGEMTNIEGALTFAEESITAAAAQIRENGDVEQADKIDIFLEKLHAMIEGTDLPFHITIRDPSGNSFVENLNAPKADPHLRVNTFIRTEEENHSLGLYAENSLEGAGPQAEDWRPPQGGLLQSNTNAEGTTVGKEVLSIPADCSNCRASGFSRMFITDIPFFKEIIIMSFNCDNCGFKSNEIKGGGAIPLLGQRSTLVVKSKTDNEEEWSVDMARDVIKSNSAGLRIPELEMEITHGSLGGMYTTVEGILILARDKFFEGGQASSFLEGDSMQSERRTAMQAFKDKFEGMIKGDLGFTLELEDPLANSYVFNPFSPEEDPRLLVEEYERTEDENEQLGLNDMDADDGVTPKTGEAGAEEDEGPKHLDAKNRDLLLAKMKDLQIGGKEAHPNADVVAAPDMEKETLDQHR